MRSLLVPLVIGLLLSLTAVFGVQWSAVRFSIDAVMKDYIARELAQESDELFGALSLRPDGEVKLALEHFDPSFLEPSSGRYYQIQLERAVTLRSPSLASDTLAMVQSNSGRCPRRRCTGPTRM